MCSKLKYAKDHQVIEVTEQYKYLNAIFSSEFYFFNKHLDGYLSRFFKVLKFCKCLGQVPFSSITNYFVWM